MGPTDIVEQDEWQPGILANINGNYTYLEAAPNYWAPLDSQEDENMQFDRGREQCATISQNDEATVSTKHIAGTALRKWRHKMYNIRESKSAVINFAATSSF